MPHDAESAARHDLAVLAAYAASRAPTQPAPDPDFSGPSAKLPVSAFTQQAPRFSCCGDRGWYSDAKGRRVTCDCPAGQDYDEHCADLGGAYDTHGAERET